MKVKKFLSCILIFSIIFILLSFLCIKNISFAVLPQYEFADVPDGLIEAINNLDAIKNLENPNYFVYYSPLYMTWSVFLFSGTDDFKAYFDGSYMYTSSPSIQRIRLLKDGYSVDSVLAEQSSMFSQSFFVYKEMYYMYSTFDIYSDDNYNDFFYKSPNSSSDFVAPYILNVEEDLAKGEEDIIIMPR